MLQKMLILFLFAAFLPGKLWASEAKNLPFAKLTYVDSPANCFEQEKYPCNLRVSESFLAFQRGPQSFHLAQSSSIKFVSAGEIQILQGKLWIQQAEALKLFVSPALSLELNGQFFIERTAELAVQVLNLVGTAKFHSQKVFQNESLPLGFQNWYGGLNSAGQVQRGIIRPIEISAFLKAWIPISGLPMAELSKNLIGFKESWTEATESSSQMYKQVIERRLASVQEKQRRLWEHSHNLQQDQSRFRQMFREKNSIPGN